MNLADLFSMKASLALSLPALLLLTACQHAPKIGEPQIASRLAVCSWSLGQTNAQALAGYVKATGLHRVQLALDPIRENPALWEPVARICADNGITLVSGMFGCVGEDYKTIDTIRATGGLVPDATWEQNLTNIQVTITLAKQFHLKLVTFHAGHLSDNESDPGYAKMQQRLGQVADMFAAANINVALETGQESAETLRAFLQKLNRANLGINFDPANLILYGKGDPIEALRLLAPWVRQVHVKDARRTKVPGTWGDEVVAGTGEVNWPEIFAILRKANFTGNFCIEREAGEQRVADIRAARDYVQKLAK